MPKIGDLVRTVKGWTALEYSGVVIGIEASSSHVNVLLTKKTTLGEQTYWLPVQKVEVISESR